MTPSENLALGEIADFRLFIHSGDVGMSLAIREFGHAVRVYWRGEIAIHPIDLKTDEGIELAEEAGVTAVPTVDCLSAEGELIKRFIGVKGITQIINLANIDYEEVLNAAAK